MPIQYIKPLEVEGNKIVKYIKLAETRKERKKSREKTARNNIVIKVLMFQNGLRAYPELPYITFIFYLFFVPFICI